MPSTVTDPPLARSSPESTAISDDFPDPDAPRMAMLSFRAISRSMPFSISTGASRVPSERVTLRARIAIVSVSAGACMKMGQSLVSRTWVYGAPLLLVQLIIGCSPSAPEQNSGRAEANVAVLAERSEEHTSELQSLMRISYAVF